MKYLYILLLGFMGFTILLYSNCSNDKVTAEDIRFHDSCDGLCECDGQACSNPNHVCQHQNIESIVFEYNLNVVNDSTIAVFTVDGEFDTIPTNYLQEYIIKDNP